MEVAGTSTNTNITVSISNPSDPMWYAAVAKNATDGWKGRRSIAVYYAGGLLNCSLTNDLSIESNNEPSDFNLVCNPGPATVSATIRNFGADPESNFEVSYQLDSEPAVTETFTGTLAPGGQTVFDFTTPLNITASGNYTLTVSVNLSGDENPSNDDDALNFYAATEAEPLDFEEPFDVNGVPPPGWNILNADNDDTWQERTNITGSDGSPTVAAYIDNFSYNAAGEEDVLETVFIDLTSATSAALDFDLAKAQYSSSFSDAFRVDISIDCGATFAQIYYKDGMTLSTVSGFQTSNWTPSSAADWRTENIDLAAFLGENVQFRFVNINGYGNSTFIDNINVTGVLGIAKEDLSNITMYPNPASNEVFVNLKNIVQGEVSITLFNSLGQRLQVISEAEMAGKTQGVLNVSNCATGIYFVKIKAGQNTTTKKLIVQ
jgi:hypothetical protein